MLCSVDIPGRPALFSREEWIWERGNVGAGWEKREGELQMGCNMRVEVKKKKKSIPLCSKGNLGTEPFKL